jgi:hypothetical protein
MNINVVGPLSVEDIIHRINEIGNREERTN